MKKILCLVLSLILALQTVLVFASKEDNNVDNPKLDMSVESYIIFPVSSKKSSVYSCLHWKTQGFIVTVTDTNGKVISEGNYGNTSMDHSQRNMRLQELNS